MDKVEKPDQEWRAALDPEQYRVTRQAGTEAPFSGQYCDHFEPGAYHCVCCAHPLFDSDSKFHSGCGWPSFHGELDEAFIVQRRDLSHGMIRTELLCPLEFLVPLVSLLRCSTRRTAGCSPLAFGSALEFVPADEGA